MSEQNYKVRRHGIFGLTLTKYIYCCLTMNDPHNIYYNSLTKCQNIHTQNCYLLKMVGNCLMSDHNFRHWTDKTTDRTTLLNAHGIKKMSTQQQPLLVSFTTQHGSIMTTHIQLYELIVIYISRRLDTRGWCLCITYSN